jgi:acyl-CoA synthetase (NDP forming)/L-amino acid N-acyltransferase YncA
VAAYPTQWEADVVLRDGSTAHVRPIRPDDSERLRAFHAQLSPETVYLRFFAPYPVLSDRDVERFTTVDHDDRVALVATVRDELVGVTRYDRVPARAGEHRDDASALAEVAFTVRDDYQGRGLGSVLLEHLAAAARERGIRRFLADVLPSNARMVAVLRDAGYRTTAEMADGYYELELGIEPTAASIAVMQAREHRAEARSVERLLHPHGVAVVGASRRPGSAGRVVLDNLLTAGFAGAVHVVSPAAHAAGEDVAGLRPYPSIADLPPPVDLVVVAVPARAVLPVVDDCAAAGVQGLVVVSAGFAERDDEGRRRQAELVSRARAGGMRVIGPNCLGVINTDPALRLNASLSPVVPGRGRTGFFSQSGAFGVALLERVVARGLGLSTFVSAGNRADVSGNDLVQYWEDDPDTDVLLLYLESIGNPRKFSRLARRTSQTKPIVAVKTGRASQGVPLGHTVRPTALPAAAVDAMFEQSGIVQVDTLGEMFDVARVLATQPLPAGRRVSVVGTSDALAVLAADACAARGLDVVGPHTAPPDAGDGDQPVSDRLAALVGDAVGDPDVDAVLCLYLPPPAGPDPAVSTALRAAAADRAKPVLATLLGGDGVGRVDRLPTFDTVEDAVRALAAVARYAEWRRGPHDPAPDLDVEPGRARDLVEAALALAPGGAWLDAVVVVALLGCYGVDVLPTLPVGSADAAVAAADALGYPVALKATAEALEHRVELGGVRLDLADQSAVRQAFAAIHAAFGPEVAAGLVVQRMAEPGVPCHVGTVEDPLFGPMVSFRVGGVVAALVGDCAYRIPPLSRNDASELVRAPRAAALLCGYGGAPPSDLAALEDLVLRLGRLAYDLPELAELELDPVLASPDGAAVLSARARVAPPLARRDGPARRLG